MNYLPDDLVFVFGLLFRIVFYTLLLSLMFFEKARDTIGITVSYWESLDAIKNWKQHTNHLLAQQKGQQDWYSWYKVRICKVEREYEFNF